MVSINLKEKSVVKYWSQKFQCSMQELYIAVHKAGPSPDAVRELLRSR